MLCYDETQDPGLAKTRAEHVAQVPVAEVGRERTEQSRKVSSGCVIRHSRLFPPLGKRHDDANFFTATTKRPLRRQLDAPKLLVPKSSPPQELGRDLRKIGQCKEPFTRVWYSHSSIPADVKQHNTESTDSATGSTSRNLQ